MNSIIPQIKKVYDSAISVSRTSDSQKHDLLLHLADLLIANTDEIMAENQKDLNRMEDTNPKKDRLLLTRERILNLAEGLKAVANLPDPTGIVLSERVLDNGLSVQKMTAPMGVVGVIYESRPNVTIDVAALCLRSGNAVILRGGSDAEASNQILVKLIHQAMQEFGIHTDALLLMPTDRKFVGELLTADQYVDILIPRGSQALIDFVRTNATVPTIETGAGVCHTYVTQSADLEKARDIVINAKTSRPSVCNALDTILVDREVAARFLPMILKGMQEFDVEIFADETAYEIIGAKSYPYLQLANESDFGREFLSFKCSVKVVENYSEAVNHIRTYSSRHSEAIISEDSELCETFLTEIDAAAVFANASTRFTDGGVFGLGAEIGISTQKLHARGPFALEKLVTEKWVVRGNGQIR
ncbi:MAG: glutamate-5-semialdehyde dehydrogenase [Bacteroidetes bacterium]|nr:glutamate-5-semialdehyde dehydrogenase [Bacteroidota bacterium]MCB0854847.1 glutamate-5-semialdehyde dehydrogenase [Bacteroidota bacterium]